MALHITIKKKAEEHSRSEPSTHILTCSPTLFTLVFILQELQELYSTLEEAKADIVGLWALHYLLDKVKEERPFVGSGGVWKGPICGAHPPSPLGEPRVVLASHSAVIHDSVVVCDQLIVFPLCRAGSHPRFL